MVNFKVSLVFEKFTIAYIVALKKLKTLRNDILKHINASV